jgi:hypothetical protein
VTDCSNLMVNQASGTPDAWLQSTGKGMCGIEHCNILTTYKPVKESSDQTPGATHAWWQTTPCTCPILAPQGRHQQRSKACLHTLATLDVRWSHTTSKHPHIVADIIEYHHQVHL